jgi:hypothetical protein
MIEEVVKAFEDLQDARNTLDGSENEWEITFNRKKVSDARERVYRAMDRWYEWKRMNGPKSPGR